MSRAKSQMRKQRSRANAGTPSRDRGWRQFIDANQLWVEIASDVNDGPSQISVRAPDPVAHEVRAIELSIARREEEREIARAIGAQEVVLLLN